MKKPNNTFLIFTLVICSLTATATDWNATHGWFKYQKDIDGSVSVYSNSAASIFYNGMLFYFLNYSYPHPDAGKIIVRKLTNHSTPNNPIHFTYVKEDDISELKDLDNFSKPCPVVFNGRLLLFVSKWSGGVFYSIYDPVLDKWSSLIAAEIGDHGFVSPQSICVVNDNLVVGINTEDYTNIFWTKNLTTWQSYKAPYSNWIETMISTSYIENDILKSKFLVGYLDNNNHAFCAEMRFDKANQPVILANKLIADDDPYSSMTFTNGTVAYDPNSTGNCVQVFLKKSVKDCNAKAYRIKRFQLNPNGAWTKQEDNLLPLASPDKMWAEGDLNLTATNFGITDISPDSSIRQYMCLLYKGASGSGLECA
jgi:hypothetical protein